MELCFLLQAEIDLADAYRIYGDKLHSKIDRSLGVILANSEIAPVFREKFRKKIVPRTPFAIYYAVEGKRIVVHGVIDQREDPERIERRI